MTDLFGEWVSQDWQFQVFDAAASAPTQTIQLLTKRPDVAVAAMQEWCRTRNRSQLPANIWMGVTIENQAAAAERLIAFKDFHLYCRTPWISYEPALEWVNFEPFFDAECRWIVLGGESGSRSRPCDVDGLIEVAGQARLSNVSVFVKQMGTKPIYQGRSLKLRGRKGVGIEEFPEALKIREFPASSKSGARCCFRSSV